MKHVLAAGLVAISAVPLAQAGEVGDFENAMRGAYADYRTALFHTNSGNADGSATAIGAFSTKWGKLISDYTVAPPQYSDDPSFAETLGAVSKIASEAAEAVESGALPAAHDTLEGIRDEIGLLHERNGIVGFSDRMNAYHAKMEDALGKSASLTDATGLGLLREDAAILSFLADEIVKHPPPEASAAGYDAALDSVTASVAVLLQACREGDAAAAKAALSGLKAPYSKLFLKFG